MKWDKMVIAVVVMGLFLPVAAFALDGEKPQGGTARGSRWAKVDLTQYCGRTVGELIDALGNDYDRYSFNEKPLLELSSCTFTYNDISVELRPDSFEYCHRDKREGPWDINEYRKETIDYIQVNIQPLKDGSVPEVGTGARERKGFAFDYAGYRGGTIDSLVRDIGYPCEGSGADTADGNYNGCWFRYHNRVTIKAYVETPIPIPANVTATNMIDDYVLQQKVGALKVTIRCREMDASFDGASPDRVPGKFHCEIDLNGDKELDFAEFVGTPEGRMFIVLLKTVSAYDVFVLASDQPNMLMDCHVGDTITEIVAGPGYRTTGRAYPTPGAYIEVFEPDGARVAYFWNGTGFQGVRIDD